MTKARILMAILLALLLLAIVSGGGLIVPNGDIIRALPESGVATVTATVHSAQVVAHLGWNSALTFTSDPWLTLVPSLTGESVTRIYAGVLILSIVICWGVPAAIATSVALLALGFDRAMLGVSAWIPLAFWCMARLSQWNGRDLPGYLLLLFVGLRLPYASGELLALSLLLIFCGGVTLIERTRTVLLGFAPLLLGAIFSYLRLRPSVAFDYPTDGSATVLPEVGRAFVASPLVGPSYPVPALSLSAVDHFLWLSVLVGAIALVTNWWRGSEHQRRENLWLAWLVIGCGLELVLSLTSSAPLAPLTSLSRMIPGAALYPLTAIAAYLLWFVATLSVAQCISRCIRESSAPMQTWGWIGLLIALTIVAGVSGRSLSVKYNATRERALQSGMSLVQLASPSLALIVSRNSSISTEFAEFQAQTNPPGEQSREQKGTTSKALKSCAPVEAYRAQISGEAPDPRLPQVNANWAPIDPRELRAVSDNNESTRLSLPSIPGTAFKLCFSDPLLRGVQLDTGRFTTDFPRGVHVWADSSSNTDDAALTLLRENPWLGSVEFTPNEQLPYFGAREKLNISLMRLHHPQTAAGANSTNRHCLTIVTTASGEPYDWSVAEVRCSSIQAAN